MYTKLILRNARRSARDYLLYIVTMTICVTLFYSFLSISSQYYHPDIGTEYNLTLLSDGMKLAICMITLLLLFLIRYVNSYMLRRKQKEFAVQSVMGMEQRTIAWIFFAETFLMGTISIIIGIFLGTFCSQLITGMLLSSYGQPYSLSWMLFPDTTALTVCFFSLSLFVVGMFNIRTIRKIKIIDMLYADKQNDPHIKKSHWMPVIVILYGIMLVVMTIVGITKMYFYFDSRYPAPVHIMFWGNIIVPALTFLWFLFGCIRRKRLGFNRFLFIAGIFSVLNMCFAAIVPKIQAAYYIPSYSDTISQYLLFLLIDMIFLVCCIFYLAGNLILRWKEQSPSHKYHGSNLFFLGQIISKLTTTSKTMTLISLTLVLSVFLFVAAPALTGWASGYLDVRSLYDIQISTSYNNVYEESDLPKDDYELVTDFIAENNITPIFDCTFNLYLPDRADFHNRVKLDFPAVAISLTDYNALRKMLGYEEIMLGEEEFTTQWQTLAAKEVREEFISTHPTVSTDGGRLTLSENAYYDEAVGETIYNSYTDFLYVFPDSVCEKLLPVMRNRYITTEAPLSHGEALSLEKTFTQEYPEDPADKSGTAYYIRTRTQQVNSTKASMFILQASMTYSAVVLMVICLTILSLQQLLDMAHYRYRFGIIRKLGVGQREIDSLVLKQLAVWFGMPILVAGLISCVLVLYFFKMISLQISAYMGFEVLLADVAVIIAILIVLLVCYFISTWILFKKAIEG